MILVTNCGFLAPDAGPARPSHTCCNQPLPPPRLPASISSQVLLSRKQFSQLGGLQLDRDVRHLVAATGEMTTRTVRDKFARLTQVCVWRWGWGCVGWGARCKAHASGGQHVTCIQAAGAHEQS